MSSRPVYYLILDLFVQRSQMRRNKFPLHKQSENPMVCYKLLATLQHSNIESNRAMQIIYSKLWYTIKSKSMKINIFGGVCCIWNQKEETTCDVLNGHRLSNKDQQGKHWRQPEYEGWSTSWWNAIVPAS